VPIVDLTFIGTRRFENPVSMVMAAMAEAIYMFQEYSIHYRIRVSDQHQDEHLSLYVSGPNHQIFHKRTFSDNITLTQERIHGYKRPLSIYSLNPTPTSHGSQDILPSVLSHKNPFDCTLATRMKELSDIVQGKTIDKTSDREMMDKMTSGEMSNREVTITPGTDGKVMFFNGTINLQ